MFSKINTYIIQIFYIRYTSNDHVKPPINIKVIEMLAGGRSSGEASLGDT